MARASAARAARGPGAASASRRSAGRWCSTGLSDVIGSWKIIEMSLPRMARISRSESASRSRPSKRMLPPTMRPGRRGDQAQDRERGHALAAAGLADDGQRLAGVRREKETPSTARTTPSRVKKCVLQVSSISSSGASVAHRHRAHMLRARRGSSASRRPSPSRLTASTVSDEEHAGEEDQVGRDLEQRAALGHDVAPARDLGRRAGAEEGQDRLDEHRGGADVGRLHE